MQQAGQHDVSRWFSSRGFTPLMEGTTLSRRSASERMVIALVLVLLLSVAIPLIPWEGQVAATDLALAGGSVLLLVLFWVARNLIARRPPFAMLRDAGWPERVAFVLIPTLAIMAAPVATEEAVELEFSALEYRVYAGVAQLLGQSFLLWVVIIVVNSGAFALGAWLRRQMVSAFVAAGDSLGRTLPLLLGVVGLVFFTNEIWQTLGLLRSWSYFAPLLLFAVVSWAFLSSRAHMDLAALGRFDTPADMEVLLADTPLAGPVTLATPAQCPLTREQENNLRLVSVVSRLTVATVIGSAIFAFFVVFGVLVADAATVKGWAEVAPRVLAEWDLGTRTYSLTMEHLKVAGFLGVFSGFYFAVVSVTDDGLKGGLRDTAEDAIREACAARLVALQRFPAPGYVMPTPGSGRRPPVVWVFAKAEPLNAPVAASLAPAVPAAVPDEPLAPGEATVVLPVIPDDAAPPQATERQ